MELAYELAYSSAGVVDFRQPLLDEFLTDYPRRVVCKGEKPKAQLVYMQK